MSCAWKRVENESSSLEYFWLRVDILGSNNLWCDDEYFTAWAEFSTHVTYDLEIFFLFSDGFIPPIFLPEVVIRPEVDRKWGKSKCKNDIKITKEHFVRESFFGYN